MTGRTIGWALAVALLPTAGCKQPPPPPAPVASASTVPPARPAPSATVAKSAKPARSVPEATLEPPEQGDAGVTQSRWIVDEPANVAPAGPASASSRGVVMVDREGNVVLASLERQARGAKPGRTPVKPLAAAADRFFSYGVGPAIAANSAFFVHGGKLQRRSLDDPTHGEVLATDARNGSRVAAVAVSAHGRTVPVVAYIAQAGNRPVAKLWIEGKPLTTLSPDGAAASSVDLVAQGDDLLAVAIEGRSGMSPVHARQIHLDGGAPHVGEDQVVWVGGSSQSLTEVKAATSPADAWVFVAIEQDTTHFGLARIHVGTKPQTDSPVSWRRYPNGLDPAPVTTATLCQEPVVLYARPAEATPHAPQELHLAAITPKGLSASQKVAFAGAFTNVSMAPLDEGALITYVGDGRTWAVSVRCAAGSGAPGAAGK